MDEKTPVSKDILDVLAIIRELLVKHDCPGQAQVVAKLIELGHMDIDAFHNEVTSVDMWGGSGAVWEVTFQGYKPNPEAAHDHIRFGQAIIRLAEALDAAAMSTERIRFICRTLKNWETKGLL